jgi:LmbE family N-acetylglucosaminyl deacetylase
MMPLYVDLTISGRCGIFRDAGIVFSYKAEQGTMSQEEQERESYERIMVVVAHPDDMEFSAGGTVAKLANEGKHVTLIQVTSGNKGTDRTDITSEELGSMREAEEQEASKRLGVAEVVFLRIGDGEVMPDLVLKEKLVRQLRIHRPDVVITHDPFRPYSLHSDHRGVGQSTVDAVYPTARDPLHYHHHLTEEGLQPHKTAELWLSNPETPDLYIDITDTVDTKIHALKAHKSQVGDGEHLEQRIKERTAEVGAAAGMEYAEAFKVIKMRR